MSPRAIGSGFADESARGIEELFSALALGDKRWEQQAFVVLQDEYARGWCGISPTVLKKWLKKLVTTLSWHVTGAVTQPLNGLGDIELSVGLKPRWIELKAQTKKQRFRDIVQVDWVRDSTDALTWLYRNDPAFAKRIPAWAQPYVNPRAANLRGWTIDNLVMADMALLTDERAKDTGKVNDVSSLKRFLGRKYLLHVTQEGIRLVKLTDLLPAAEWLAGNPIHYALKMNKETAVAVQVSFGTHPGHGATQLTYHVAYRKQTAIGRHKLHAVSVAASDAVTVS